MLTLIIRRGCVMTAFIGLWVAIIPCGAPHAAAAEFDPPNIVFIMVDDMGRSDLGVYGQKVVKTPALDRMAAEGMVFTQAYSGSTVCAPARSVLMTGYHAGHAPVRSNTGGVSLRDEDVTIAEVLQHAGYVSGAFGKWGQGDVGTPGVAEKQGFDVFFGYYHQVHAHYFFPPFLYRNSERFPLPGNKGFYGFNPQTANHGAERFLGGPGTQYTHEVIFEHTLQFIRDNKDRRFFCYAPWTPPHGRYEFPADDPAWAVVKDKPWPNKTKVIAAMNMMIDRHVGQVIELLKELQLDRKTIVFFCSDHGAAARLDGVLDSMGRLRGNKRKMYEGGLRVPLIARWPGHIEAGSITDHVTYFGDFMATFAELSGTIAYMPSDVDSISIVPTLLGDGEQHRHEYLYWEWTNFNWSRQQEEPDGLMQAVRMGDWKLLRHKTSQPWELYNLANDEGEWNNLAETRPDVLKRLAGIAKTARTNPPPQIEPKKPAGYRYR